MIKFPRIFSATFERFLSPDIFLRSLTLFGGKTFGAGVTISSFQMWGNSPLLTMQLMMFARGAESSGANSLMSLAGMSFLAVDVLVLIDFL